MLDNLTRKSYLGDGVYVGWDGYQVWLYTLEGMQIALEPMVLATLLDYTATYGGTNIER